MFFSLQQNNIWCPQSPDKRQSSVEGQLSKLLLIKLMFSCKFTFTEVNKMYNIPRGCIYHQTGHSDPRQKDSLLPLRLLGVFLMSSIYDGITTECWVMTLPVTNKQTNKPQNLLLFKFKFIKLIRTGQVSQACILTITIRGNLWGSTLIMSH